MVGLVDQYTETELTEARFPALPSGKYRFEVLCVSADGKALAPAGRFRARGQGRVVADALGPGPLGAARGAACVAAVVRWRTRHLEAERHRLEEAVAARSAELAAANRELREASFTDALTGARNRRFFSTVIEDDVNRTLRVHSTPAGQPAAQLRPDLLHRRHRPLQGDQRRVRARPGRRRARRGGPAPDARRARLGPPDPLGRRGVPADLPRRGPDPRRRARRARHDRRSARSPSTSAEARRSGAPARSGWAPFPWYPDSTRTFAFTEVLKLADRAMYLAKQSGRNRSVGVASLRASTPRSAAGTATGGRSP